MATMTTLSTATISSSAVIGTTRMSSQTRLNVKCISGLKAHNKVATLGLTVNPDYSFAKIVNSFKAPSKAKGIRPLSIRCNAAVEIFRIASIIPGLVLVGVAVGFVLLRLEAAVEESD